MPKRTKVQANRVAAGLPAKGKLMANLSSVSKEDRARAGITDEMANRAIEQQKPTGVEVKEGPWQESEDHDVVTQIRVLDHDDNVVLFSGTKEQYEKLKKAINKKE
jgi:hypothetical protein